MIIPNIFFLKDNEQLLVESFTQRYTINGPKVHIVPPFIKAKKRFGITLTATNYIKIKNTLTGKIRIETGPKIVFLDANEISLYVAEMLILKHDEYIKIIDKQTSKIKVESGEKALVLEAYEEVLEPIEKGINIDSHTAVLIRDTKDGSQKLIKEEGVFFPSETESIIEIRKKILLENHEVAIVKDKNGKFTFKKGSDLESSFFLEPYEELLKLRWASGIHKDRKELIFTHIDLRPKFMWYEFECRTKDNVELIIGITFFWQILNVEKMVSTTDDCSGDVCSHARSIIIQTVSKSTLEEFLSNFNGIIKTAILNTNDYFYADRGVEIHSIEVRSISCKDSNTQEILNEIIQETTNRLNNLQKQEGENEVKINKIKGEIEAEKIKTKLLEIQYEHLKKEAEIQGESEALKVKEFFNALGSEIEFSEKMKIFNTLKKQESIDKISKGKSYLYYTPNDIDLKIETST